LNSKVEYESLMAKNGSSIMKENKRIFQSLKLDSDYQECKHG